MTSQQVKQPFRSCRFLEQDDITYLKEDVAWVESRAERLNLIEKENLFELIQRLHTMDIDMIRNPMFFKKVFSNCFSKDYCKELVTEKRKPLVRNIFWATVTRELILRTETSAGMQRARDRFLQTYPFLQDQEGTDLELTWLVRYERALRYLVDLLPSEGSKTSMMNVAAHLQGASVFTEYITGGANKPETQRRVDLHQAVTNYTPYKRAPRAIKQEEQTNQPFVKRGRGRPRKDQGQSRTTQKQSKKTRQSHTQRSLCPSSPSYSNSYSSSQEEDDEEVEYISIFQEPFVYDIIPASDSSAVSFYDDMPFDDLLEDEFSDFESSYPTVEMIEL